MSESGMPWLSYDESNRQCRGLARLYAKQEPDQWKTLQVPPTLLLPDLRHRGVSELGLPAPVSQHIIAVSQDGSRILSIPIEYSNKPDAGLDMVQVHTADLLQKHIEQQRGVERSQASIEARSNSLREQLRALGLNIV